jgi:hypothetical protein
MNIAESVIPHPLAGLNHSEVEAKAEAVVNQLVEILLET